MGVCRCHVTPNFHIDRNPSIADAAPFDLNAARRVPPPKKLPKPSLALSLSCPTSASTAPPRHGRKPGSTNAVSRNAREAARKSNHSRIEKLGREKINDVLSSLRELVPHDESAEGPDKKGNQEKDFKLEILERTVIYLTKLKQRVQELEGQNGDPEGSITPNAERSAAPSRSSSKHRRDEEGEVYDGDELADDEDNADEDQDMDPSRPRGPPSTSSSGSSQVQTSPYLDFPMSPPDSGRSRPQQPIAPPPTLRLPASLFPKRGGTPLMQDEAASMLVQFSAERSSLSPRSPGSLEQYQQQVAIGYHCSVEQGHLTDVRPIPRSTSKQAIRQMHSSHTPVVLHEPSSSVEQTPASMLGMSHLVSRMDVDDSGPVVWHKRQRMA
ncbi:hypothetical protein FRC01_012864 [Tulasnella sp. 417]|nr:hypothetical protein FRC01_012864 [Tulasnella sp. 417]